MNREESKLAWNYITLLKASQDAGHITRHLSGIEFKVLAYIGWRNNRAFIQEIVEHPAYNSYSLSTIKRAILNLKSLELIESRQSPEDGRVMILSLRED